MYLCAAVDLWCKTILAFNTNSWPTILQLNFFLYERYKLSKFQWRDADLLRSPQIKSDGAVKLLTWLSFNVYANIWSISAPLWDMRHQIVFSLLSISLCLLLPSSLPSLPFLPSFCQLFSPESTLNLCCLHTYILFRKHIYCCRYNTISTDVCIQHFNLQYKIGTKIRGL